MGTFGIICTVSRIESKQVFIFHLKMISSTNPFSSDDHSSPMDEDDRRGEDRNYPPNVPFSPEVAEDEHNEPLSVHDPTSMKSEEDDDQHGDDNVVPYVPEPGRRWLARVRHYHSDRGFGFAWSPEIESTFGCDVFLHAVELDKIDPTLSQGVPINAVLSFEVCSNGIFRY